jgi:hypothetical protein
LNYLELKKEKMINFRKSIFTLLVLVPMSVFGQNYEEFSPELKQKVDQNKQEGLPVYTGIETVYAVDILNITSQNLAAFSSELSADNRIKEFTLSANLSSITVVCFADYQIEDVKAHLSNFGAEITNYSQLFRLQN